MTQEQQDKQAFFAQYWGLPIQNYRMKYSNKRNMPAGVNSMGHLLLKPLSAITDEDAIELAQRLCPYMTVKAAHITWSNNPKLWFKAKGSWANAKFVTRSEFVDWLWTNTRCADYLRRNGFLIQYDNYTEQQLLDMGWAKLKTKV